MKLKAEARVKGAIEPVKKRYALDTKLLIQNIIFQQLYVHPQVVTYTVCIVYFVS
jgi:hypothetical protein